MIQGLYEAHLPVSNLNRSIEFYQKLSLALTWRNEKTAFFWIEEGKSWLGLWEAPELAKTPYHPSTRHIAFRIDFPDMRCAVEWLSGLGIVTRADGRFDGHEPTVRPGDSFWWHLERSLMLFLRPRREHCGTDCPS